MINQTTTRHIPQNSIPVEHGNGLGVAYVYRVGGDRYAVIAYSGKRSKADFHYSFKTIERAHDQIEYWFNCLTARAQRVKDRRKVSYDPHTLKVGDIITNSWGYDQTNVDWYVITKATKNFVWLQPIAAQIEATGHMSGASQPFVNVSGDDPSKWGIKLLNEPVQKHKATGSTVCMECGVGSKWDGRTLYASWYH
jgi:hypothetical protein